MQYRWLCDDIISSASCDLHIENKSQWCSAVSDTVLSQMKSYFSYHTSLRPSLSTSQRWVRVWRQRPILEKRANRCLRVSVRLRILTVSQWKCTTSGWVFFPKKMQNLILYKTHSPSLSTWPPWFLVTFNKRAVHELQHSKTTPNRTFFTARFNSSIESRFDLICCHAIASANPSHMQKSNGLQWCAKIVAASLSEEIAFNDKVSTSNFHRLPIHSSLDWKLGHHTPFRT